MKNVFLSIAQEKRLIIADLPITFSGDRGGGLNPLVTGVVIKFVKFVKEERKKE